MVDTHALGACAARRGGSPPFIRTIFIYKIEDSIPFSIPFLYHYLTIIVGIGVGVEVDVGVGILFDSFKANSTVSSSKNS